MELPKLYLHIGAPKCGSSSIQAFLGKNRESFEEQGIWVADRELYFEPGGRTLAPPVMYLAELADAEEGEQIVAERLKETSILMREKGASAAVISAENLFLPTTAALFPNLSELFRTEVICYIRRQDDWLLSAWKQWGMKVGQPLSRSIEVKLEETRRLFLDAIDNWESKPWVSKVTVKPLGSEMVHEEGLLHDFCEFVGAERTHLDFSIGRVNRTLSYPWQRVFEANSFLFENAHDNRVFAFLEKLIPAENYYPSVDRLGAEERGEILRHFEEENSELAKRYFNGVNQGALGKKNTTEDIGNQQSENRYLFATVLQLLMHQQGEISESKKEIQELRALANRLQNDLHLARKEDQENRVDVTREIAKAEDSAKATNQSVDSLVDTLKQVVEEQRELRLENEELKKTVAVMRANSGVRRKLKRVFQPPEAEDSKS